MSKTNTTTPADMATMFAQMQAMMAQLQQAAPAQAAPAPVKAVKATLPQNPDTLLNAAKSSMKFVRWDTTEKGKPYAVIEMTVGSRVSKACLWM